VDDERTISVPKKLAEQLEKYGTGVLDSLAKRTELFSFKAEYNVSKASGLKCPFCSTLEQKAAGSLWYDESDYSHLVCRKCLTEFSISSKPYSISELIENLRKIKKGEY